MSKWEEDLHPRGKGGKFGSGSWVGKLDEKITNDRRGTQGLAERLKSGEVSTKKLSGGTQANVELVKLGDGTQIVRKTIKKKNQARQLDAEELSSKFALKLGITAPAVHRDSPTSVVMDHMDGVVPSKAIIAMGMNDHKAGLAKLASSKDGAKLGLFDLVVHNTDRNSGNWLVGEDNHIQAIDHGMAFQEPGALTHNELFSGMNPFINGIAGIKPGPDSWLYSGGTQPKSTLYSKADIAFMHEQLASLEPDFNRLGRMDWFNNAQDQLDELNALAIGKGKLF